MDINSFRVILANCGSSSREWRVKRKWLIYTYSGFKNSQSVVAGLDVIEPSNVMVDDDMFRSFSSAS